MTPLEAAFDRLFVTLPCASDVAEALDPAKARLTRALVIELCRPADWATLARVWRGVQTDLDLSAPAIAVNGRDGLQLWFSLREPVHRERALAWLDALRQRYLSDVAPTRVRLMAGVRQAHLATPARHATPLEAVSPVESDDMAPRLPALQPLDPLSDDDEHWSAFIAQDLAPIFDASPWLDIPPGDEGQLQLLSRLESLSPDPFTASEAALAALRATATPSLAPAPALTQAATPSTIPALHDDPRAFLLAVMNDPMQAMALRIEAAKALLPWAQRP